MRAPLFKAVGCVVRFDDTVLLLRRSEYKSYPGAWKLPGGKIEPHETAVQAAVRELYEETHILVSSDQIELFATYPIENVDMAFEYSAFLHLSDQAHRVELTPSEHSAFLWASKPVMARLPLVPGLKTILDEIERTFSPVGQMQLFELPALGRTSELAKYEAEVERSLSWSPLISPVGPCGSWYVAIGPPGAGKSTTLRRMSQLNPLLKLVQDNTILKQGSRLNNYLRDAFEHRVIEHFFHFQMEVLPMRWHQVVEAPHNALLDESIFSTLAYSRALLRLHWITKEEYQTFFVHYCRYAALLRQPTTVFYFRCDGETLRRRIRRRGRVLEVLFGKPYLDMLVDCFDEVALELSSSTPVVRVDTTRASTDEIVSRYAPKA